MRAPWAAPRVWREPRHACAMTAQMTAQPTAQPTAPCASTQAANLGPACSRGSPKRHNAQGCAVIARSLRAGCAVIARGGLRATSAQSAYHRARKVRGMRRYRSRGRCDRGRGSLSYPVSVLAAWASCAQGARASAPGSPTAISPTCMFKYACERSTLRADQNFFGST